MKKQIFVMALTLAAAAGFARSGEARSLEEILREKGVITAEEYRQIVKEAPAEAPALYKPGQGFTAASGDGRYKLKIGGYAQLIYKYSDFDDSSRDDVSDFDIRRFKLQLSGNVLSKDFGFKFQADMKEGFTTEDAFINYRFGAPLTVQVGQFKPPQARQELTSASRQLFPERSLANDTFNLGRDQGIQAAGAFPDKLLAYRLGIFNGNGPNTGNPDNRHMVAGRLDINPLSGYKLDEAIRTEDLLVNVGGSFAWNKIGANDVGGAFGRDNDVMDVALGLDAFDKAAFTAAYGEDLTWLLWTANVNASWMGASFAAEYYDLNADPDLGSDWDADGYYVQAGYQMIPRTLELAARYSEIESHVVNASASFDKSETQFGVNYYFAGHAAKLQADYTMAKDDLNDDRDDDIFRLQAQFYY